ncbi:glycoside hydrolase superfamily [Zychaea mexicana]|uniref:glycoside hydrolase superfamily n=1 Tax=Zychaea mexicana TaxID=64656 RepID=UPI0022FDE428|nr:glycoside hydrolase superfamily [Zychaea mexicana]KAI9491322.1 glycoside hydrolase superfamily [Zychaea mexicana]
MPTFYYALLLAALCLLHMVIAHDAHQQQAAFGLEQQSETPESVLRKHDQVDEATAHEKTFKGGDTLAYVTPWNNRGYDIVKEFKGKFDYVSPVWYYIEAHEFMLIGEHDVDENWIKEVRDGGGAKIVPRFQFRNWEFQDYQSFVSNAEEEASKVVDIIMNQVRKYGFDGIVLECGYPTFFPVFVQQLSTALHASGKQFIIVLPPLRSEEQKKYLNADIFASLARVIDRFSIMTYDYSSHIPSGGPSAPIDWIIDNIEQLTNDENRHQLLVGLNMYAIVYHETSMPQPLVLKDVIEKFEDWIEEDEPFDWDREAEEHHVKDMDGSTIWLPTLRSIRNRVHLAEDYGVGLALWEVGQGLDYFYNLL